MIGSVCVALALTCLAAPAFAETCTASRYGYGVDAPSPHKWATVIYPNRDASSG
jgi:hypothetical protein